MERLQPHVESSILDDIKEDLDPDLYEVDFIQDDEEVQFDGMIVEYLESEECEAQQIVDSIATKATATPSKLTFKKPSTKKLEAPKNATPTPSPKTNKTNIYKCNLCSFSSSKPNEFDSHITMHEDASFFICDTCGKGYKTKSALAVHIGIHFGRNTPQCHICNKKFTQRGALVRHMPIHTGEKPYQVRKTISMCF